MHVWLRASDARATEMEGAAPAAFELCIATGAHAAPDHPSRPFLKPAAAPDSHAALGDGALADEAGEHVGKAKLSTP